MKKRIVIIIAAAFLLVSGIYIYYRDATKELDFTTSAESIKFETLPLSIVETPIPKDRTDGKLCFVTVKPYLDSVDNSSDFDTPSFSVWCYGEKASDITSENIKIKGYKRIYFFDVTADDKIIFVAESSSTEIDFVTVKNGEVIRRERLKTPPVEMRAYINDVLFLESCEYGYVLNLINSESGERKEVIRFEGASYFYRVEGSKLLYETNPKEADKDKTKSKIAIYENGTVSSYLPQTNDLLVGFTDDLSAIYYRDIALPYIALRSAGAFDKYNLTSKTKTTVRSFWINGHFKAESFLLSRDGKFALMYTLNDSAPHTFAISLETGKSSEVGYISRYDRIVY